jgi:hypothetical protein
MAGSIPIVVTALFNSRYTMYFQPHYGPGIDFVSNRNVYQEYSGGKERPERMDEKLHAIFTLII